MTSLNVGDDEKVELPATSGDVEAAPAFVPRSIARNRKPPAKPNAAALLARGAVMPDSSSSSSSPSTTAPAAPAAASSSTSTANSAPAKITKAQSDHLEAILCTIEAALSDFGLSVHGKGGILERFSEAQAAGKEACKWHGVSTRHWRNLTEKLRAGIHVSQLLQNPAVRALTGSIADIQKAIRSRESDIISVSRLRYTPILIYCC